MTVCPTRDDLAAFLATGEPDAVAQHIEICAACQAVLEELTTETPVIAGPPLPAFTADESGTLLAGRYRLETVLGEGGMGTVWAAVQIAPVRRPVAVKVVKAGMDTAEVLARFEGERQALALMDHPNIAKVLDAGVTSSGRPFFVMERVHGMPLNRYCDQHRLSVLDRLKLFGPVCSAVQHAHQKGIVHRDLKPGNILVDTHDGRPLPKVIDFGLAKAIIGPALTERTMVTAFGAVAGTPAYMAPEQAGPDAADIDARADIYALGVILYELLTGTTPLAADSFRRAAFDEILRLIREQEPLPPSNRLSSGDNRASVAAVRQTEPDRLRRLVRGDLDWIVLKALAKDRSRRYDSATALADDLERFLNHEPVKAGPPSRVYQLRKFLRRNRVPALAAALVAVALIAGTAAATWGLVNARAERDAANAARHRETEERRVAENIQRFLQDELLLQANATAQADALVGLDGFRVVSNPTVRDLLDRAAARLAPDRIEKRFPNQPLVQANLLTTVGIAYRNVGAFDPSAALLRRAATLFTTTLGDERAARQPGERELAETLAGAGRYREAVAVLEPLCDLQGRVLPADDVEALRALKLLATACWKLGDNVRAAELLSRVDAGRTRSLGPDHVETLGAREALGLVLQKQGKAAEAMAIFEAVRDARLRTLGPDHPATLTALHNIGLTLRDDSRQAAAIPLLEQVRAGRAAQHGPDHPTTLTTESVLAGAYLGLGRATQSLPLLEKVYAARIAANGPDSPDATIAGNDLAAAYSMLSRRDDAIALYTKVLASQTATLGVDHVNSIVTASNLARTLSESGRQPEALARLEELWRGPASKLPLGNPVAAGVLNKLAETYQAAGRTPEALALFEDGLRRARAELPAGHRSTRIIARGLAIASDRAGDWPRAEELFRELHTTTPTEASLAELATILHKQSKWADAEPLFRELLALRERTTPDSWMVPNARSALGDTLLGQAKLDEAEPLLRAGFDGLKQRAAAIPPALKIRVGDAARRLARLCAAQGKAEEATQWQAEAARWTPPAKP